CRRTSAAEATADLGPELRDGITTFRERASEFVRAFTKTEKQQMTNDDNGTYGASLLPENLALRALLPREEHHQLAQLLQKFHGKDVTAVLLTVGDSMTEAGRSEFYRVADEAGIDPDECDRWSEHPRCFVRALRAAIETLNTLLRLVAKDAAEHPTGDKETR